VTKRLLLIEFFPTALRRNEKSMLFPFLQGLARDRGGAALWLCFGGLAAPAPGKTQGRSIWARPRGADLRRLAAHLDRFRPSHVVTSDLLGPEARSLLASRRPRPAHLVMPILPELLWRKRADPDMKPHLALASGDPRRRDYFGRCAWLLDWLGRRDPVRERQHLLTGPNPDYSAVLANAAARRARAHITIVSGALCANRRLLSRNPYFQGLARRAGHRGCSFCSSACVPSLTPPGGDMVALVEKQFRRIQETAGSAGRDTRLYEFYDSEALPRCDEIFAAVLRLRLPPSVFLFNPRIDDVLRARRRIESVLPALADAGHEVRCLSMGVENFSERENRRFNKGISLSEVDELLALTRRWDRAWPGVFKPFKAGHEKIELGFIMFTPWTTLGDIRLNLDRARRRRFSDKGYWLYSTLHIRDVEPIHRLALKEGGILTPRWPDPGQAYGLFKNEGEAGPLVPWRFKDPRAADFFALLVRVCAADRERKGCAFFRGDPEFELARSLYARARARGRVTPLGFALALLKLMEKARPPYARADLLRQALVQARRARRGKTLSLKRTRLSPAARAVARDLARLKADAPLRLLSVQDLPESGPGCLRLELSSAQGRVIVDLLDARSPGPAFLRSRLFRAVYHPSAPVSTPEQARYLAGLLRVADASVRHCRAAARRGESTMKRDAPKEAGNRGAARVGHSGR
jgi:hypothetical protein